jgi:hypothetical protein
MTKRPVYAAIVPYYGETASDRTVSRMHKDTARLVVLAPMRTENPQGEKISDPGTLRIEVEVNTSGLVAVTASDADRANTTNRPLFYGALAIGDGDQSGTRVRRETHFPALPDDILATLRAVVGLAKHGATTAEDLATVEAARAILRDR